MAFPVLNAKSPTTVGDDEALFELLASGRVETLISVRCPLYLNPNRKHAALVPAMADPLRRMKRDGSIRRIMISVLGTAD